MKNTFSVPIEREKCFILRKGNDMIFYFSSTGNSKHVADMIAQKTNEEVISMADCVKKMRYDFKLKKGERIGFVYPIYCWSLPSVVEEFVRNVSIEKYGKHYTYSVATCGVATGGADMELAKILSKKGIGLHATFSVTMVDNYTLVFNVKNASKNEAKNLRAEESIKNIVFLINNKTGGYHNHHRGVWPASKATKVMYNVSRKTSPFKVSEDCIGCGLCAKQCPTNAISLDYGKPVWKNKKCALCLGCLHNCPVNAINYGPTTKHNGQYKYTEIKED